MPHNFEVSDEIASENAITVAQQVTWNLIKREGLPQLLAGPLGGGMSGDIKMDDPPAVVREHYEHIENLKSKRGHGKEVDRNHGLDMVVKKGPPRLRGRMAVTDHVLAHTRLADVDIQLEQFPVNPWCAP